MQSLTPSAVRLQLASPAKRLPARPGWFYEPKLDGCRVLVGKTRSEVQVRTRGGHLVQCNLPEVVNAAGRLEVSHVVLDGELVVLDEAGGCDFDAACDRLKSQHGRPATVFVFDILALEGEDLRTRPLRERKRLLAEVLGPGDSTVRPVHFISGPPDPLIAAVEDLELEGIVAKWEGAPYQGGRTFLWQKLVLRRPTRGWRVGAQGRG